MAGREPGIGYEAIADELRRRIESGELPPGAKVPSEAELKAEFKVGRETASKVRRLLQDEGLTETRQGAATRVRVFKPIRRAANKRLSREVWGGGTSMWAIDVQDKEPVVDGVEVEPLEANPRVAEALGIRRGERVIRRRRRYLLDGKPVLKADSYLPASIAEGTRIAEIDTGEGGIYARLEELGHRLAYFKEEVRTRMPSREERVALEIGPGTPVLAVVRVAITDDDRAVEVNEMLLDGGSYILDYVMNA